MKRRWFRAISGLVAFAFTLTQVIPAWAVVPVNTNDQKREDMVSLKVAQAGMAQAQQQFRQRILIDRTLSGPATVQPPAPAGKGGTVRLAAAVTQPEAQPVSLALQAGWNLLTVPGRLDVATAETVLATLRSRNLLQSPLWTWTNGQYVQAATVEPGRSYWVKLSGGTSVTLAPRTVTEVTLDLEQGPAMIGNPFAEALPVEQIRVTRGGETVTLPEAVARGWLWSELARWDAAAQAYTKVRLDAGSGAVLPVGQGIWLKALQPVTIGLRPVDRTPPAGAIQVILGTVVSGTRYVTGPLVTLSVTATDGDSGVRTAEYSVNGGGTWNPMALTQLPTVSLALPLGDGPKSLTIRVTDWAGQQTTLAVPEPIVLDTTPPVLTPITGPSLTNAPQVSLTWSATDATSAVAEYRWRVQAPSGTWSQWISQTTPTLTLQSPISLEGQYTVELQARDTAGNWSASRLQPFTVDRTPPTLTLTSPTLTNQSAYTAIIQADGVAQPSQTWRLGRGTHQLIAEATDAAGNVAWNRLSVTRAGDLPAWPPIPSLPEGARLTQTLTDGSIATYVAGQLIRVTTPNGTVLAAPTQDAAGTITGGWLTTPDGTTTYLQGGTAVVSRDRQGTLAWYFPDGRVEAVRTATGATTAYAYQLDAAGQVVATLLTAGDTSTLLNAAGQPVTQLRVDGRRLTYTQGRLARIEQSGQPVIPYAETPQADGTLVRERPATAVTDLPQRFRYTSDGTLTEVTQADGTRLRFTDGLPTQAVAPDGTVTTLTVQQSGAWLDALAVTRSGITRTYDAHGQLTTVQLPDHSAVTLLGEALHTLQLPDGTQITDGVFDASSHLVSGLVTLPDGRTVRYAAGQPTEAHLPDGTTVTYANGQPSRLTLTSGLSYALRHLPESQGAAAPSGVHSQGVLPQWLADLSGTPPGSDTLTRLLYTDDWTLQEATRADGAELLYTQGRLTQLTKDGAVTAYTYDATGRLAKTVTTPATPGEPLITTEYAYDKIRRVFRGETLLYEYTYEFPDEHTELTVLHERATGLTKRYRDDRLISQTDPDGAVTTYTYTTNPAGDLDPLDVASEAVQTLPDSTLAHYQKVGPNAVRTWRLMALTLPDGRLVTDLTLPAVAARVAQAALPTDWASLRRLERQGILTAVNPTLPALPDGPPRVARAIVTYHGLTRETFRYRYDGALTQVTDQTGVTRTYAPGGASGAASISGSHDAAQQLVALEQADGARYTVASTQDLSQAQLDQLKTLAPDSPEALAILQHPNGPAITTHHLARLLSPDGTAITQNFPPETVVDEEFDAAGQLISRTLANGQVTLYDAGLPAQIVNAAGQVTTTFTYDAAGQLVKLTLLGARAELADQVAQATAQVIRRRADALEELAKRKAIATGSVTQQLTQARQALQTQLTTLTQQLSELEATSVRGKQGRREKSKALDQLRAAITQVRSALGTVDQQEAAALGELDAQIASVRQQLEADSADAQAAIARNQETFLKSILRQETAVILQRLYRTTIGRDPDETETAQYVEQLFQQFGADPAAALNLTAVTQAIKALPDYQDRVLQVALIRRQVSDRLTAWSAATPATRAQLLAPYGLTLTDVVPLDAAALTAITAWLNGGSLHFGHSAFLALQGLLSQSGGVTVDAATLATEAVWLDILAGVITPKTQGDLELSLFTLQHVAQRYGLALTPAQVSFEELKALLPPAPVAGRLITPDGTTAYELGSEGIVRVIDLATQAQVGTISLTDAVPASPPTVSLLGQTPTTLSLRWRGVPVGAQVSTWVEGDLRGESGVWYIQPIVGWTVAVPAHGYTLLTNFRAEPPRQYRQGHTRLLVVKDPAAFERLRQRLREAHVWVPADADSFFKDRLTASDLQAMLQDPAFMAASGLMVWDLTSAGALQLMSGSATPSAAPGITPQQAFFSPDGATLWVLGAGATRAQSGLFGIDVKTRAITRTWTQLGSLTQATLSRDGQTLYVVDAEPVGQSAGALVRVEATTGAIRQRAALPVSDLAGIALTAQGSLVLASRTDGRLRWVDATTLQVTRTQEGLGPIQQLALRPDGQVLYLVAGSPATLRVLDATSGATLKQLPLGGAVSEVAFSPDGTVVYLTRQDTGTVLRLDAASHQPLTDAPESESAAVRALRQRTAPVLAHVNGNHYLHLLAITPDGSVIVREPNKGPTGAIVTMSAAEFQQIWKGVILTPRAPPKAAERLTVAEAKTITGAFFPVLIAIFAAIASGIGTAVSAIVGAVTAVLAGLGTLLTGVFSGLSAAFTSIGSFFGGFGSLFSGFGLIGQGVSALFAGQLLGGLSLIGQGLLTAVGLSSFSLGALGQFALTTAVNVGVSKGLEALGVSPTIASLTSAFVSGGVQGFLHPVAGVSAFLNVAGNALTSTAIVGTQLGLVKTGLDPTLAGIAGIGIGSITNSLTTGVRLPDGSVVNGLRGLGETLHTTLLPTLAGELGFYGVTKLGETIGLDSRISLLAGIPIRTSLTGVLNGSASSQIVSSIGDGLVRGATQVGFDLLGDHAGLDPFLTALSSRALTSAVAAGLNPHTNIFEELGRAFWNSAGRILIADGDHQRTPYERALYLSKVNDFASVIREEGLAVALEHHAASILTRDAVEAVWQAGGIASILSGNTKFTTLNGVPLKEVRINKSATLYFDAKDDAPIGRQIGNKLEWGIFGLGEDGAFFLRDGSITVDMEVAQIHIRVKDGEMLGASTDIKATDKSLVVKPTDGLPIKYDQNGTLQNGVIENTFTGTKVVITDGIVRQLFLPNPDGSGATTDILQRVDLTNVPPDQLFGVVHFALSNGVGNLSAEGLPAEYMKNFGDSLAAQPGVNAQEVMAMPLYESGNLAKDVFSWLMDALGTNLITNKVIHKMDAEILARGGIPPQGMTVVTYSGSYQPFLKAIQERGYNISTIVAVGAPTTEHMKIPFGKSPVVPDQVKRIVYVAGDRDTVPLVEHGKPDYRHKDGTPVETIFVHLSNSAVNPETGKAIGVNHTQYFAWDKTTDPYVIATHRFLAELTKFSQSGVDPRDLLRRKSTQILDDDVFVLDVSKLIHP